MRPGEKVEVYVCRELVDMRKSINGLSILVEETLGLNPFGPELFVFCNRKRDKVKILYWERSGFVQATGEAALSVASGWTRSGGHDDGSRAQLVARWD